MSDLISTQESVTKIIDAAIRKILSGEQKLTKEYEQSVVEAVDLILNTARRTEQPIIRCKECKYWSEYEYINGKLESFPWCELNMAFSKEDDFFLQSRRKEN